LTHFSSLVVTFSHFMPHYNLYSLRIPGLNNSFLSLEGSLWAYPHSICSASSHALWSCHAQV